MSEISSTPLGESLRLSRRKQYQKAAFAVLGACVTVGLLVALILFSDASIYLHVDEVMNRKTSLNGKSMQVHGFVTAKSLNKKVRGQEIEYVFTLENCGISIPIQYSGILPDTFEDEAELVVDGVLAKDGTLKAKKIMTKCPSKYEKAEVLEVKSKTLCQKEGARP